MSRRKTLPLLALLCAACCCFACDDGGDDARYGANGRNGSPSHTSKKDKDKKRDKDEPRRESPKGEFKVGRLDTRAIPESSGLVASRKHPGVFWTQSDSGNGPAIFAVARDGTLLGQYTLNVRNNDWEAIAADDEGNLYVGDIGNNEHQRDRVLVYRVAEPDPTGAAGGAGKRPATGSLRVSAMWRLDYPGKPFDAESLFVHGGKGYVISKLLNGKYAGLYSFDLGESADARKLSHVCDLPVRSPVSDAAISPDGAKLAVMTVTGPYLFQIDGDLASAAKAEPKHQLYFDVKDMNMEGVCFVDGGLLATTEQGQVLFFADKLFSGGE